MAQLVLYLDADTAAQVEAEAKRAGQSRSAWARAVLKEKLRDADRGWPPEFLATYGSWEGEGDESLESIIRAGRARDFERKRDAFS
ncbi:MAG: ribbon-helix-helix protein, CopG family [Tepidiformaceae bacterium]